MAVNGLLDVALDIIGWVIDWIIIFCAILFILLMVKTLFDVIQKNIDIARPGVHNLLFRRR